MVDMIALPRGSHRDEFVVIEYHSLVTHNHIDHLMQSC